VDVDVRVMEDGGNGWNAFVVVMLLYDNKRDASCKLVNLIVGYYTF